MARGTGGTLELCLIDDAIQRGSSMDANGLLLAGQKLWLNG